MNVEMAFLLTILAGLSTGIGSLLAFFIKNPKDTRFLTLSMSFAAGVMLYVSFVEIMPHAVSELDAIYNKGLTEPNHTEMGHYIALICFFAGMALVALIDRLIPHDDNPHELMTTEEMQLKNEPLAAADKITFDKQKLMRVGLMSALALALHNFPEGIATFAAALNDVDMGITIAFAIAMHNIPEGIAVAVPIYYATGSRSKAFWYSFLSGIVEPLGAFVAYFFFGSFLVQGSMIMPALLAGVAGIMIFISLDQLLPAAERYGKHHLSTYGIVAGMVVMAISMLMLGHDH
jgi:zinc transporter, ZIP family